SYKTEDPMIDSIMTVNMTNKLVRTGANYDVDILNKERERITRDLKKLGYFAFEKEYIFVKLDSSLNSNSIDVFFSIRNPELKTLDDSIITGRHQQYFIKKVNINTIYNPILTDTVKCDTAYRRGYYFLFNKRLRIKSKTFAQSVFIKKDNLYSIEDVENTYKKLAELQNFRMINIYFEKNKDDSLLTDTNKRNELNCQIHLSPVKKNSISFEVEGTNTTGNLGLAGNMVYQNNNLLRGAEFLRIKLKGALAGQTVLGDITKTKITKYQPFNTYEIGTDASIYFPKFLLPVKQERISKNANPKTNITVGIDYQQMNDYTRYISNLSFGYDWKEGRNKRHILNVMEVNSVKVTKIDSVFYNNLLTNYSSQILRSYQNHMTFGPKYSFIYNNQDYTKIRDFSYFRVNAEFSGISWITNIFSTTKNYSLFNIPYSQYWRIDADFRHYYYINQDNVVVMRSVFGWGVPQGKDKVLPFEKSFNAGGANDVRAWKIRSLGPGSFNDGTSSNLERAGDMLIEENLEYRFPLYKYLKGALFIDAGNVWLVNKDESRPGGEFDIKQPINILRQFAIGGGFGTRFDFKYFVIRLDFAVPMRDPSMPEGKRWVFPKTQFDKLVVNLGIGYPF
ncbi:MAG: BamA/TamA family outer membrane protein, partial [Bacteroidota bacterium]|nr:BamA/TamA family outer membrane protein [Bacteroidota bacterium]